MNAKGSISRIYTDRWEDHSFLQVLIKVKEVCSMLIFVVVLIYFLIIFVIAIVFQKYVTIINEFKCMSGLFVSSTRERFRMNLVTV